MNADAISQVLNFYESSWVNNTPAEQIFDMFAVFGPADALQSALVDQIFPSEHLETVEEMIEALNEMVRSGRSYSQKMWAYRVTAAWQKRQLDRRAGLGL